MIRSFTWPTIGVIALLGAGLGVHLGHSAAAGINPIYFSEPAPSRFFADLAPQRPSAEPPSYLAKVEESELRDAMLGRSYGGCFGCGSGAYPEEYVPVRSSVEPIRTFSGWAASPEHAAAVTAEPVADEPVSDQQAELASVQRFASYPVTSDEAAAELPAEPIPVAAEDEQPATAL